jgi:PAS domain S-box-containing protein
MNNTILEAEQLYWNIFETTTDGLIINDLQTGRVLEANPAACAMLGYTRAEFIGLFPAAFIHSNSQKDFSKSL